MKKVPIFPQFQTQQLNPPKKKQTAAQSPSWDHITPHSLIKLTPITTQKQIKPKPNKFWNKTNRATVQLSINCECRERNKKVKLRRKVEPEKQRVQQTARAWGWVDARASSGTDPRANCTIRRVQDARCAAIPGIAEQPLRLTKERNPKYEIKKVLYCALLFLLYLYPSSLFLNLTVTLLFPLLLLLKEMHLVTLGTS